MPTVTLLEKAYGAFASEELEKMLKLYFKELKVQITVKSRTIQNWIQVEVTGEDTAIALKLVDKLLGLAPTCVGKVKRFSLLKGKIIGSKRALDELLVDVGVFEPRVVLAKIPLQRLQAQIADGKNVSIQDLISLYSLCDNMPIQIKIVDADLNNIKGSFEAEVSEQQLCLFTNWIRTLLDRLMVLGVKLQDVEQAIKTSKHYRDITRIEYLGLLENAVLCRLGTDAVGLIPEIGNNLRAATLAPFSPRKIIQIIGRHIL